MADGDIRILIVDDQEIIRDGLALVLSRQSGINVLATAADGQAAVVMAQRHRPDVVLLDLQMPHMTGVEATRHILNLLPQTRILVLTTYASDELVFDAIRAGAHGYLLKGIGTVALAEAIRATYRGEAQLDPQVASKVLDEFRRTHQQSLPKPTQSQYEALTEREYEVLACIAQGLNNREICDKLYLSEGTVRNHVSNILTKLHVNDRTQALVAAVKSGIVKII